MFKNKLNKLNFNIHSIALSQRPVIEYSYPKNDRGLKNVSSLPDQDLDEKKCFMHLRGILWTPLRYTRPQSRRHSPSRSNVVDHGGHLLMLPPMLFSRFHLSLYSSLRILCSCRARSGSHVMFLALLSVLFQLWHVVAPRHKRSRYVVPRYLLSWCVAPRDTL
jgi:hypothetical protein